MKNIMILTAIGTLLIGVSGCRFWNCLWRGPAYQTCQPTAIACPPACPTTNPCDPCSSAPASYTPGPETYAPAN
ncbi:MAG: hypothetical protein JW959_07510 [Pirellulales bacterium]|nr:hypothetical protein [Pirellulales bacterium]